MPAGAVPGPPSDDDPGMWQFCCAEAPQRSVARKPPRVTQVFDTTQVRLLPRPRADPSVERGDSMPSAQAECSTHNDRWTCARQDTRQPSGAIWCSGGAGGIRRCCGGISRGLGHAQTQHGAGWALYPGRPPLGGVRFKSDTLDVSRRHAQVHPTKGSRSFCPPPFHLSALS
jgi:hypothetical protein